MSEGRKSLKSSGSKSEASGELVIVRPSELAKSGKTGLVAQGVFEKAEPNKFNPANKDYFVRDAANDTLYIINSTAVLAGQMEQLDPKDGTEVEITYAGMKKAKNGKSFHDFEVWVRG